MNHDSMRKNEPQQHAAKMAYSDAVEEMKAEMNSRKDERNEETDEVYRFHYEGDRDALKH